MKQKNIENSENVETLRERERERERAVFRRKEENKKNKRRPKSLY